MDNDYDLDAYVDRTKVLSDSSHVARKFYECMGCEQGCIALGDRYRRVVMLDHDGRFDIVRQCVVPCAPLPGPPATTPTRGDPWHNPDAPEVVRRMLDLRHWTQSFTKVHPPQELAAAYAYMDTSDALSRAWRRTGDVPGYFATVDLLSLCEDLREAYVDEDLARNRFPRGVLHDTVEVLAAHRDALAAALADQDTG